MPETIDLSKLDDYTTEQLTTAAKKINKNLEKRSGGELRKLRLQLERFAKQLGYNIQTRPIKPEPAEGGKRRGRRRKEEGITPEETPT
jgi:hypothetical protein